MPTRTDGRPEIGDEALLALSSAGDGEPGPVTIKTLVARGVNAIVASHIKPAEGAAL